MFHTALHIITSPQMLVPVTLPAVIWRLWEWKRVEESLTAVHPKEGSVQQLGSSWAKVGQHRNVCPPGRSVLFPPTYSVKACWWKQVRLTAEVIISEHSSWISQSVIFPEVGALQGAFSWLPLQLNFLIVLNIYTKINLYVGPSLPGCCYTPSDLVQLVHFTD